MNIKSYTDIEQSKKLAEILPLESADMCFANDGTSIKIDANSYNVRKSMWKDIIQLIPCWSLAALYQILPNTEHILITLSRGGWKTEPLEYVDTWWCEYEDGDDCTKNITVKADNPVDACYGMIMTLKEKDLL